MRPLDGLKVLDIATVVAGPFAATSMAEFGAEVIKIEIPGRGCTLRKLGTESPTGDTYWWLSDARNKKSVELDLRTPEGAGAFRALARDADVIVENFRPGTLERWGLGFESLRADNPGLIMLSVTGFGQDGPKADLPGMARIAEGFAGFTFLTGHPDGPPLLSGASALGDYITGTFGVYGVMLALRVRDTTGRGQRIDLALYEGILRFLDELAPVYSHTGHVRQRMASETHRSVPHSSFQCADGSWMALACTNDTLFYRLAEAMGRTDMITDPRYATNAGRIERRWEVNGIVADWLGGLERDAALSACADASVPAGPILAIDEIINDPQVLHRGSIRFIEHPTLGPIAVPGVFPRLMETPGEIQHLGPELGADNAEVLGAVTGAEKQPT